MILAFPRRLRSVGFVQSLAAMMFLAMSIISAAAQEPLRFKITAPDNQSLFKRSISGGYFVAKPLKEEYDRLTDRLRLLKADIDSGRMTGAASLKDLGQLQIVLDGLRAEI